MEPGNQSPERMPNLGPAPSEQSYPTPEQLPQQPELGPNSGNMERLGPPVAAQEMAPPPPPTTVAPILPAPVVDDSAATSAVSGDDTPLVAGDDDVIEKEWVDKIKKVLVETKEDPYKREQAIKRLQIDYVKKRYGREIGERNE